MSSRLKTHQPRLVHHDQFGRALRLAKCLPPATVDQSLRPISICFRSLREGVANEKEWAILVSALSLASALETHALRHGTQGHIKAGLQALEQVMRRAMAKQHWMPVEVHLQEIDDIRVAIELHEDQLRQVDQAAYATASSHATTEVRGTAGVVLDMKPAGEQLAIDGIETIRAPDDVFQYSKPDRAPYEDGYLG